MDDRADEKERRRAARVAEQEAATRAAARRRRLQIGGGVAAVVAIVVLVVLLASGGGGGGGKKTTTTTGSTAPFVLGTTQGEAVGATVDGIQCQTQEQVIFHIHAHLAVFVSGRPGVIPEGIGIAPPRSEEQSASGPFVVAGSCFYWLHSHTDDGVIHIESPLQRTYTLGDYFDIWHQPLSATEVGRASGPVTAYVNGHLFAGDPRTIPLNAHAVIQLDVGTKVAPLPYTFPSGL
jgi:hypothetical protein